MRFSSLVAVLSGLVATVAAGAVSYPRPDIYSKSAHFSLKVNGEQMYTVSYDRYDYVHLSMDTGSPTEFRIKAMTESKINTYRITPMNLPIKAKVEGQELVFSLKQAHYLIVKINDRKEFVIMIDPKETDVPKERGDGIFNVLDYKADNTGKTLNAGIQSAMDAAGKKPGSIVYVPPGLYQMGNLVLRNRTSLYLAGGATLRFTGNAKDYKKYFKKGDLFDATWWISTEFDSQDIKIYGRGTIDGNGKNTRDNKYMAKLVVPAGTKNFRFDGPLVRDGSFWAVTPIQVTGCYLTNIKILDRFDVTQNDGIDVIESTRVTVRRAIAIANDDSFSTKTWLEDYGQTVPYPYRPRELRDVTFDDCLAWTYCYGYKVGQGVHELQENVVFKNSVVYKAGVGLGIHHLFGTAAANKVTFENIDIEDLAGSPGGRATWLAIWIREGLKRGVGPITNTVIKNIKARKQGGKNGFLSGWNSTVKVSGVTFSDVYMNGASKPATTLKEMNLDNANHTFTEGIKFANTK
jgi:polygalacturonase|uniref:Pectate lyase superfamily protein domain-containing protein n=1 Tax=Bionectria ochroleuca TaxID=29856 RepID=A0A8H7N057_BIOOC